MTRKNRFHTRSYKPGNRPAAGAHGDNPWFSAARQGRPQAVTGRNSKKKMTNAELAIMLKIVEVGKTVSFRKKTDLEMTTFDIRTELQKRHVNAMPTKVLEYLITRIRDEMLGRGRNFDYATKQLLAEAKEKIAEELKSRKGNK